MPKRQISIYALVCPLENSVKYIGQTTDLSARYFHYTASSNNKSILVDRWLDRLSNHYLLPTMVEIRKVKKGEDANEIEKQEIIRFSKHFKLLNFIHNPRFSKPLRPSIKYLDDENFNIDSFISGLKKPKKTK